jgi:AraC family transcriptional regulator
MYFDWTLEAASEGSQFVDMGELATSVIRLLQTATNEIDRDREAAKTFIARAASLLRVGAERGARQQSPSPGSGRLAAWQIQRVKTYVEKHLAEPIRVGDLSAVARLSTSYFSRVFKQSCGEAPHSYVVRRRLDRARHLMLTSDEPLCEVALACGFADQAHFSKLFHRATGKTAAIWRRERNDTAHGAAANVAHYGAKRSQNSANETQPSCPAVPPESVTPPHVSTGLSP